MTSVAPPPSPSPGTIVFSHANGFPAGTYRTLFRQWLRAGYRVHALEKFGHDPRYPVTSNWPHLGRQLVHFMEREVTGPAFLVGHSLGGLLSLLAAAQRPELARGVVLLDSPIPSGLLAGALRVMKLTGLGRRFMPSAIARKRRDSWLSVDEAFNHFAIKAAFSRFDAEVLRDYIRSALEVRSQEYVLAFRRDIEADIYDTLPHHLPSYLRRHPLRCGVAFIGGRRSIEVRRVGMRAVERITQGRISWIDGSHLFPFEHPDETASDVMRWLTKLPAPALK